GRIERIQRFYDGVTQSGRAHAARTHSLAPVAAMEHLRGRIGSDALPNAFLGADVLSRDFPINTRVFDLTSPSDLFAYSERVVRQTVAGPAPARYSKLHDGVLLGCGGLVHESAWIRGQVVIQPGAVIRENASIVGPCVIGEKAIVGAGAVVAQSIVGRGREIAAHSSCFRSLGTASISQGIVMEDATEATFPGSAYSDGHGEKPFGASSVLEPPGATAILNVGLKRAFDVVITVLALCISLPVLIVAAILVKLESRGPLLFIHHREGRRGGQFPCFKFRTMIADAHDQQRRLYDRNMLDGPHFKISNDPRVTRVGRILRKYNIDELPQLFNVLAGHMSLVGPRPSPFRENQYCVPWRRARLSVRPGVTGLWQICRTGRHEGDFQQWIHFDMTYVRHMSPWLDVKILAATIYALVTGKEVPLPWLLRAEPERKQASKTHRSIMPGVSRSMPQAAAFGTETQFQPVRSV
ncbi:MAG TPA: sugar transferase, partial [Phycisphaerae bacterium]|nr:sugar transferase [Phycisphaerae bacterium]